MIKVGFRRNWNDRRKEGLIQRDAGDREFDIGELFGSPEKLADAE